MRIALVLVLAGAATAVAQPSSKQRADATAAYQEGQRRYLDEDYVGAAAQFEAAYKLDPDPAYEFNIAQAYRLAKNCEQSLRWYRKFLADAPKAPNVAAVKKYIADEEAACAKPAPTPAPAPEPEQRLPPEEPPSEGSHLLRNLGIGSLGVGALGLTLGIVFTVKVYNRADEREHLCPAPCSWNDALTEREARLEQLGQRNSKLAITSYAIGGIALGAGLWLIASEASGGRESPVAIVPTRDGGFVTLTFRN